MDFKHVGERIKELMEEKGITYEELARRSGKSTETIRLAINKPEARTIETLSAIANALGVSILYLLEPYPIVQEGGEGKLVKTYFRAEEKHLKGISRLAEDLGVSKSEVIRTILSQGLRMYRVLCPECDGIFWVEKEKQWKCCPYCGAREDETVDDFVVQ